ncbi:MAG: sigma-70 family RNA polymerase sigma factor [Variibacter sp.]
MRGDAVNPSEMELATLMRSANSGDGLAYEAFLKALLPTLRAFARQAASRAGSDIDAEDIVQETLIAIHLKRQTWIDTQPIGPWIRAIVRHKAIDALRRRGRRVHLPVEDFENILPAEPTASDYSRRDLEKHLPHLTGRQRDVMQAIAMDGRSIAETAQHLDMREGAVRVALHRGVSALARILGGGT